MVVLFVLVTFGILILIDVLIFNRSPKKSTNFGTIQVFNSKDTLLPKGYYYSKGHTWVNIGTDNKVNVGLDGFILNSLGKLKLINLPQIGKRINKGDVLFESSLNNVNLRFRSPINGIVSAVNTLDGELSDPEKWCVNMTPSSMKDDFASLIADNTASKWIKSEFRRLKDLLIYSSEPSGLATATMYDGGNIAEGAIQQFDENVIKDFEELFLKI